jgi:4-hydroxythreonine-4-phosphate dehydrogenase
LAPLISTRLEIKKAFRPGRPSAESGRASFAAVALASSLAARDVVGAVVTSPISKEAWMKAGVGYPDHTEFFRDAFPGSEAQMVLGAPEKKLWCVLSTRHMPLSQVSRRLNPRDIVSASRALGSALKLLGFKKPRLGLCAFNPHAGENGLLGREEKTVLAKAIAEASKGGLRLSGPIAADTAWRWHSEGLLDGLVCLYHDQALIPLKIAAGLSVVNWTVGLPFPRTSPGHGTGFDAARSGRIDSKATEEAALLAARLA